jgi:hypothetical protein
MAVGARIFGQNRLLTSNAVVDIESSTPAPAGGTQHTWAAFASSVDVLITTVNAAPDYAAGVNAERVGYKLAGVHVGLMRSGIRIKVTACPDLPDLVGRYLAPQGVSRHPAGRGGLLAARINLDCTVLQIPGDDGSE